METFFFQDCAMNSKELKNGIYLSLPSLVIILMCVCWIQVSVSLKNENKNEWMNEKNKHKRLSKECKCV